MNKILSSTNTELKVTNLYVGVPTSETGEGSSQLAGLPLGTSDGSATGEIAVKVKIIAGGGGGGGVQETPAATVASSSGSVAAGARSVLIVASNTFVGTVLGQTLAAGASLGLSAQSGNTLGAVPYTMSAGSLTIYTTT